MATQITEIFIFTNRQVCVSGVDRIHRRVAILT